MIEGEVVNAGACDPDKLLKALAVRYGLIGAELCAEVADAGVEAERGGGPGDLIRGELLDYRVREARYSAP